MNNQELLLRTIQKKIDKNTSLIDEIATVLNISYDASHRRVSVKSKFSIEEAVQLCLHYNISMDSIIRPSNKIVVEKTSTIQKTSDLLIYLKESYEHLKELHQPSTKLYYSAKDIPLFYTIGGTLLSKFKLYVWSNLLVQTNIPTAFEKFYLHETSLEYASLLQSFYSSIEVHEIWSDTTINSTVQQIFYFFESGLIQLSTALQLYEDVRSILNMVEDRCIHPANHFYLYYNELLILNNNVIVGNESKKKMFVPYTMLGYFITMDEKTTIDTEDFFKSQMKNSKLLNLSGTRDRKIFFNKAHKKVDFYVQKIQNYVDENNF